MGESKHLFVTGMPRSGTTLLDKLLSRHPLAQVHSQPLPLLYVDLKLAFLEEEGRPRPDFPFDDLFGSNWYEVGDFADYLQDTSHAAEIYENSLERMREFDGQYTKPDEPYVIHDDAGPWTLFDFVTHYARSLIPAGRKPEILGTKETFCEELVPYFLRCGARVLLILRDPRDVLTSLNYGRGARFGGRRKPHLWNLRQWRKSVAFALAYAGHPRFQTVRFEDLVCAPVDTASQITAFLGLDPFDDDTLLGELFVGSGEKWLSNSSHRSVATIDASAVGRYRDHLDRSMDFFVQAVCYDEMQSLGYRLELSADQVPLILARPLHEEAPERPELSSFQWCETRRDEEVHRFEALRQGDYLPSLFLFEQAFQELRKKAEAK